MTVAWAIPSAAAAQWTTQPVDLTGDSGWRLYLELDPTGTPHASYSSRNGYPVTHRTSTGWQETDAFSRGLGFALDRTGAPYYFNLAATTLFPQVGPVGGPPPSGPVENIRISSEAFFDFDHQNRPRVAYIDPVAHELHTGMWDGANWDVDMVVVNPDFKYGNSQAQAAIDSSDQMHFMYSENGMAYYAQPNGSGWDIVPTGLNRTPMSMAFDQADQLYALFYASSVWSLARLDDTGWTSLGLTLLGPEVDAVVRLDPQGHPHVFAHRGNVSQESLVHFYEINGSWRYETIDTWYDSFDGPEAVNAVIDRNYMHVLYSTGNQQVFYASYPVPEPASIYLAGAGLAALGIVARRRRRRVATNACA